MNILLVLVPLALMLLVVAIAAFVWAVKRGQFDDLDTPALDILREDDRPPEFLKQRIEQAQPGAEDAPVTRTGESNGASGGQSGRRGDGTAD